MGVCANLSWLWVSKWEIVGIEPVLCFTTPLTGFEPPHNTALRMKTPIIMKPFLRKVKAIRISSKRTAPAATAREPTTDWLRAALDIARRAAMADDLVHVPSIKDIADIFTQMLAQLEVRFIFLSKKLCSIPAGNRKRQRQFLWSHQWNWKPPWVSC